MSSAGSGTRAKFSASVVPAIWTVPAYIYWAVLHGFVAKRALRVSVLRAVVMVVVVNFGSFVLMALPVALLSSLGLLARSG